MRLEDARRFALSLPETTEEPHFDMSSYRVRGKIFATVPPDQKHLRIFVGPDEVHAAVSEFPRAFEELWWGKELSGVGVNLHAARRDVVCELLESAWRRRAPKTVLKAFDSTR